MQVKSVRLGEFKENALEIKTDINPQEIIEKGITRRLNFLLGLLKVKFSDILPRFIKELQSTYESLVTTKIVDEEEIQKFYLKERSHLVDYPRMACLAVNFYFQQLQLPEGIDWKDKKVSVTERNNNRSFLLPSYYLILALTKVMERDTAIKLFKQYISLYTTEYGQQRKGGFVNLETLYEEVSKPEDPPSSWVVVRGMLSNGKYFYRNDNCLWVEALDDIDDRELLYMICCYGDYQSAKTYYDKNIILTMEHTIAEGDPYCSRVLHDTRVDWDLRHPKKEFWDNLQY
ncbi:MAG: L-2-amino-thiazoline-4-carboxylic acid hydrolase [Candidatus Kariarchaeaceae archaeon]|jgi:hypothetical protein